MDHESDSSSEIVMRDQHGNVDLDDRGEGFNVHEEGGTDALEEESRSPFGYIYDGRKANQRRRRKKAAGGCCEETYQG